MRLRSAAWLLLSQVSIALLSFPLSILLARTLGATGKGTVSLVQLIADSGAIILGLGVQNFAVYYSARQRLSARQALVIAAVFGLAALALGAVALSLFGSQIALLLFKEPATGLVAVGFAGMAAALVTQVMAAFLSGQGAFRQSAFVSAGLILSLLLVNGSLAAFGRLNTASALATWLTLSVVTAGVYTILSLRYRSESVLALRSVVLEGASYSVTSWVTNIVSYLAVRLDMFLVAALLNTKSVGIYSVAVTFAQLSLFVPNALSAVLLPKAASAETADPSPTQRVARLAWPATAVISMAVWIGASLVVPILFGEAFAGSVIPLLLLTPAMIFASVASVLSAYLSGRGFPRDAAVANALNLIVNVALNIVLIPVIGVAGASVASSISYGVSSVAFVWFFVSRTGTSIRILLVPQREDWFWARSTLMALVERGKSLRAR